MIFIIQNRYLRISLIHYRTLRARTCIFQVCGLFGHGGGVLRFLSRDRVCGGLRLLLAHRRRRHSSHTLPDSPYGLLYR